MSVRGCGASVRSTFWRRFFFFAQKLQMLREKKVFALKAVLKHGTDFAHRTIKIMTEHILIYKSTPPPSSPNK